MIFIAQIHANGEYKKMLWSKRKKDARWNEGESGKRDLGRELSFGRSLEKSINPFRLKMKSLSVAVRRDSFIRLQCLN